MHISRIQIKNFRNFRDLDVATDKDIVIVGENRIGKSNLLYALRLLLDPSLPDSARILRDEDFWDGLRPRTGIEEISISVEFSDFEDEPVYVAVLADFLVETEPMVARLSYRFGPVDEGEAGLNEPDFMIFGGDDKDTHIRSEYRRRLPLDLMPALRDAEGDLANWKRSPLRPLLDEVAGRIDKSELEAVSTGISTAQTALANTAQVAELAASISVRLSAMVGQPNALDLALGFSPTEPERLIRALRLFIDGGSRSIGDASLGSANLLYVTLRDLELQQLVKDGKRDHTFWAIEEPEAHLHPHLQRLVYRDFLRSREHQCSPDRSTASRSGVTILMTTHSPHIGNSSARWFGGEERGGWQASAV